MKKRFTIAIFALAFVLLLGMKAGSISITSMKNIVPAANLVQCSSETGCANIWTFCGCTNKHIDRGWLGFL